MDASILLTTNALLSSTAALVMLVVLRTRKTYAGFGFWTAGVACLALGAALLVPNVLPQSWGLRLVRNATLLGGYLLILRGMLLFRDQRVGWGQSCCWPCCSCRCSATTAWTPRISPRASSSTASSPLR